MIYGTPTIHLGDVRTTLAALPADSVHCAVTSPPYWGLRSYLPPGHPDKGHEIGSEPTPEAFVETMVGVFREVRRVLHPSGVMGLNIGDSYCGGGGFSPTAPTTGSTKSGRQGTRGALVSGGIKPTGQFKPKDLMLMPWRVFMALQADGWYVRSIIVWHKPAPMPESCTDRPTSAWEPIALMSKRQDYFWDADAINEQGTAEAGTVAGYAGYSARAAAIGRVACGNEADGAVAFNSGTRNARNVWRIASEPWSDPGGVDHFAAFPTEIPRRFVKAGTSEKGCCPKCLNPWERVVERTAMVLDRSVRTHDKGQTRTSGTMVSPPTCKTTGWRPTCDHGLDPIPCTVLDPFSGTGSTGVAACQLGRNYIGCELFESYAEMSKRRIEQALRPGTFRLDIDPEPGGLFSPIPR